jgi:predicted RNase H-related nuclease YkuK (DUF458 family)
LCGSGFKVYAKPQAYGATCSSDKVSKMWYWKNYQK